MLGVHALRSYLKLICEYELYSLLNKKVSRTEDHGKNYIKVRPPLVRHLFRNCVFKILELLVTIYQLDAKTVLVNTKHAVLH